MIISSITNPVRWYTDLFESDRFANDCDLCDFELISDKTRLLPFQYRRNKSGYPISKWFLRRECDSIYTSLLNSNDSLFTLDSGYWSTAPFNITGGKAEFSGGLPASTTWKSGIFTAGKYYMIKVVVSDFVKVNALFSFKLFYKTAKKFDITGPGTYYASFIADSTDLVSVATIGSSSDKITFESIEINEYEISALSDDVELPTSLLTVANISSTEDIIQYDGTAFDFQIPCGKYYMITLTDDYQMACSELITVKDFIPSQSPYTMIEWSNSCDIGDTIYQTIVSSNYINRMYIDGDFSKPIYPFKEEGEEDGNYKLNILFQKWEKQVSLMVAKCPEFIVDALSSMRLNDTIFITRPLRKKQIVVTDAIEIEKVEAELTSIFNDCATNCELKITLKNKIVDSACCENSSLPSCIVPKYIFSDYLIVEVGNFFGEPTFYSLPESVYSVTDGASQATTPSTFTGSNQYYFNAVDITSSFPVGTKVRFTGTYAGIHKVTLSAFAIGTTLEFDPPVTASDTGFMYAIIVTDIGEEGDVVSVGSDTKQLQSGVWETISEITSFTYSAGPPETFFIQGTTYSNIYVRFVFTVYDDSGPTTVTVSPPDVFTSSEFKSGITLNVADLGITVPMDGYIDVIAVCYELNCDYGETELAEIVFNP